MGKNILSLALSTFLLAGFAHAEDTSSTLAITGSVTDNISKDCGININQNTFMISESMKDVIDQGTETFNGTGQALNFYFTGGEECITMATNGRLAYRLTGTADNADGTALANMDVSQTRAKGLGIGLYDKDHNIFPINKELMIASPIRVEAINFAIVKLTGQEAVPGTLHAAMTINIERL